MDNQHNVTIRRAASADLPAIYALMAEFDMVGEFEANTCLLAESDGVLLGFIRLENVNCQTYIRPLVVSQKYQGMGIGKALLQRAINEHPNLMATGRGDAVGFYTQSGFSPTSWDQIYPPFAKECETCPDADTCKPVPLMYAP